MENICFVDANFLNQTPLTENNIIEYFATSPFYDTSSNNEVVKMQSLFSGNKISQPIESLKGVYFSLDYKNEDNSLFIIKKALNTGTEHINLNFYYVIFGHIYESPTTSSLFISRSTEAFWGLNKLLDIVTESLQFDPFSLEETKIEDGQKNANFDVVRDIFDAFNKINASGA